MKKIIGLVCMSGLLAVSRPAYSVDSSALIKAFGNIATQLAISLPRMIEEIPQFPEKIKTTMAKFKAGYQEVKVMPSVTPDEKEKKDKKLVELFIIGVTLLIDVNNIADNFLGIVKELGPVIGAANKEVGAKVGKIIQDIVDILFMFARITQGTQRVLCEQYKIALPAGQAKVNKAPLASDDL